MTGLSATIVLPTYGRPGHLRECLESLARLDGGPWPVIVVDDGSPEPVEAVCAEAGPEVRYVRQENAGPAAARNRGIHEAKGDLILLIDDDCRPHADWAQRLVHAHAGDAECLVGGRVVNALARNPFSDASQAILTYSYGAFGAFDERLAFFTTNNLCMSRQRCLSIGGFDTRYDFASEDRDFSFRWKASGGRLAYASDAVVDHRHELDLAGFLTQHYRYGRGARRFHGVVAGTSDDGVKLGKANFYAGLLLHPLRRPSPTALLQTGLIGLAHAALAAGYVREARTERRPVSPP